MNKTFIIIVFICIIAQFPLLLIYQHYLIANPTANNLTLLMTSFESIGKNTTFSCSFESLRLRYELEYEQLQHFQLGQIYTTADISQRSQKNFISSLPQLPYFYSLWKSSQLLPRIMTACQHQVYIQLLREFDNVCRQNDVEYIISHGTLLGSYRNHGKIIS